MNNITKGDAVLWFTMQVGLSDGGISEDEYEHALVFGEVLGIEMNVNQFMDNLKNGYLNEDQSLEYMHTLTHQDRIDCLVACIATAMADGKLSGSELVYIHGLAQNLDVEFKDIVSKYNQLKNENNVIKIHLNSKNKNAQDTSSNLIQNWLIANSDKFSEEQLNKVKEILKNINPNKVDSLLSIKLVNPANVLLFAWLLGVDRLLMGQVGLGFLKLFSYLIYGLGLIWWLLDALTAKKRAYEHNFKIFNDAIAKL